MEKHNKIKNYLKESKEQLDLLLQGYQKDLNDEIYENIICAIDHIIDTLYGAQLKAIELDEIMEENDE